LKAGGIKDAALIGFPASPKYDLKVFANDRRTRIQKWLAGFFVDRRAAG